MKRFKKLALLLLLFMVVSGFLSVYMKSRDYGMSVPKGYAFGAPNNQTIMKVDGVYSETFYGFPSTYKVTETFRPTGDVFNALSYDSMPSNPARVIANFIFWMGLFVALLAPITIFWRPKKKASEIKLEEKKTEPQVKTDAHTGN